jgi:hypothetical protein
MCICIEKNRAGDYKITGPIIHNEYRRSLENENLEKSQYERYRFISLPAFAESRQLQLADEC